MPLRLVILGVGDHAIAEGLRQWEANHPDRVKLFERFDIELAQRIYSGCDMFLMPSSYEPCGLGQMFAMRYGTVPIVRHTGGLADTVFEGQNGFLFEHRSAQELLVTIRRALAAHADPVVWHSIVSHAMSQDFGWDGRGHEYIRVYERAIKARSTEPETSSSAPCSCG